MLIDALHGLEELGWVERREFATKLKRVEYSLTAKCQQDVRRVVAIASARRTILIRAILGKRVRQLLEKYAAQGARFYAPEAAFADAEKYLPPLLSKRGKPTGDLPAAIAYLRSLVEALSTETFAGYETAARQRLRGRDEDDWSILAAELSLACGIWTEDADFFGAGVSVWTTDRVEIFLAANADSPITEDE